MGRARCLAMSLAMFGCQATPAPPAVPRERAPIEDRAAATETPRSSAPIAPDGEREPESGVRADPGLELAPPRVALPLVGTVVAHGGGALDGASLREFAELCGAEGKLVLIPTAIAAADAPAYREKIAKHWRRRGLASVVVLHTNDRVEADNPEFVAPLHDATCAWIGGGDQGRLERTYVGTRVEDALHALVLRGGAVGGYSAGAAVLSRVMIRRGNPEPEEGTGLGLLPGVIVDQHFVAAAREPRLRAMLQRHPELVGFGIDERTRLVVSGDRYRVVGDSVVHRCTPAGCVALAPGASGTLGEE